MAKTHILADLTVNNTEYVRLSEIERFDDNSGWRATMAVGAGEFVCRGWSFYFNEPQKFLKALKECNSRLSGVAELKTPYEEEYLRFSFSNLGHVQIAGLLREYGGRDRYFRYGLEADQTFVSKFIESFEAAVNLLTPT